MRRARSPMGWAWLCAVAASMTAPSHAASPDFAHPPHLEEGAACADCHQVPAAGPPTFVADACEACHDDDRKPPAAPQRLRRLRIAFPHGAHRERTKCADCHGATARGAASADAPVQTPDQCLACHAERPGAPRPQRCERCHGADRRRVPPADHGLAWPRRHGAAAADLSMPPHGRDCRACHAAPTCAGCHQTQAPRSHTGLWRERAHGAAAAWDRGACKTCHETGACVGCHQRTTPRDHRGPWRITHSLAAESPRDPRCLTCHSASGCAACHRGGR